MAQTSETKQTWADPRRRYERPADFDHRMAQFHEVTAKLIRIQPHACRDHPLELSRALSLVPEYPADLVADAVGYRNDMLCDPFRGL